MDDATNAPVGGEARVVAWRTLALDRLRESRAMPHVLALGVFAAAAAWLLRRALFTSALPAGTDMLGFIARARQNGTVDTALSLWAPNNLGAPRQYTLDNLLGLLTAATGDPVVTVKALVFLTLLASGAFTYLLALRWYERRSAAVLAGLLYMTSQSVLSRWGTGVLNVEIAIAFAPLLVYLWVGCVERFSLPRSISLALAVSGVTFVRPDMTFFVAPFLGLFVVVRMIVSPQPRRTLRNATVTFAVVVVTGIAVGMAQIVPYVAGVRAQWLSADRLFDLDQAVARSVDAYASLLGFAREIGYLAFTGQQTWATHPWLPFWAYAACASVIVALAFGVLARLRDERTLFLLLAALLGTFLAKGVRDPLGGTYLWAIENVPVFGNLRATNRWLIVQALAYSVLGALAFDLLARRAARLPRRWRPLAGAGLAALLVAIVLPVAPTLLEGFRTWRPTPGQLAILAPVERDRDEFSVASIPYDQTVRFLEQDGYRGFEHDLGGESPLYTGHPTLGDGGWHQPASDFVAYTERLLRRRDPAFQDLLGTAAVKYLAAFDYPATAPHLQPEREDGRRRDPAAGSLQQQRAIERMPGFGRVYSGSDGELLRLSGWSPIVSFRPNVAVVLGGRAGYAALASLPGVDLRAWAALGAADLLERGGVDELVEQIDRARLVVIANERLEDVAVLSSAPVGRLAGLTSDQGLDLETQLIAADESVRRGALIDATVPPPRPETTSAISELTLERSETLELWTRIRFGPVAGRVVFSVDGRRVGQVTPLAVRDAGFRWVRVATSRLGPGAHRIAAVTVPSLFGTAVDVDESRLVRPSERRRSLARLEAAVRRAGARTVYSLDLEDALKWADPSRALRPSSLVAEDPRRFWRPLEPARSSTTALDAPGERAGLGFAARGGRRYYTLLEHRFGRTLDWSANGYIFLDVRGTGSGEEFRLVVRSGTAPDRPISFGFVDDRARWRTLVFSLRNGPTRNFDWSRVDAVKLVATSKQRSLGLGVGRFRLGGAVREIAFSYPIVPFGARREAVGGSRIVRVEPGSKALRVVAPAHVIEQPIRLLVRPRRLIRQLEPPRVRFERTGATTYRYELNARSPGLLVLALASDEGWRVTPAGGRSAPMITVFSLLNGYSLSSGRQSGTVRFDGERYGRMGIALSGFAILALGGVAAGLHFRRNDRRPSK